MINLLLIGMTEIYKRRITELGRVGPDKYFDTEYFMDLIQEQNDEEIWSEANEQRSFKVKIRDFVKRNPDYNIPGFDMDGNQEIILTEFAPKMLRNIRKDFLQEHEMLDSFIPANNQTAIYNFKLGQGKSPSFFFFSDNKLLMLKTCTPSEKKLLFDANFLSEYFKYIMLNPDTLLMKIFGCYEVILG